MPQEMNPFDPNNPIYAACFTGRVYELSQIEAGLRQAARNKASRLLIVGERGSGKTSLLHYARHRAKGEQPLRDGSVVRFLTVFMQVRPEYTVAEFTRALHRELEAELEGSERVLSLFKKVWGFAQRVEAGGVKIGTPETQSQVELVDECIRSIIKTVQAITAEEPGALRDRKDGLAILIDESDAASPQLGLGTWVRTLAERLALHSCGKVVLLVAGLPGVRQVLAASHASSLRMFEDLRLDVLSQLEIQQALEQGLEEASTALGHPIAITPAAITRIEELSEGYPYFVQQFAHSAYDRDTDDIIDEEDVNQSAIGKRGALAAIAAGFYEPMWSEVTVPAYRDILRVMAECSGVWMRVENIRERVTCDEDVYYEGLRFLIGKGVIQKNEADEENRLRIPWRGFGPWLKERSAIPKPY